MLSLTDFAIVCEFASIEDAINAAVEQGHVISKHADPMCGERRDLSRSEALDIAREDASLLFLDSDDAGEMSVNHPSGLGYIGDYSADDMEIE